MLAAKIGGQHVDICKRPLMLSVMSPSPQLDFDAAVVAVPEHLAGIWGFRSGAKGTHTSRTIMLADLTETLHYTPHGNRDDYAKAIVADNCLAKRTLSTRKRSAQRLRELYALDPSVLLFRVLLALWAHNESSRPLLALLLALARDPLLRATASAVLSTPVGDELARQPLKDAVSAATAPRLNDDTVDKVVRYASSSWTQSGHLHGGGRKTRRRVQATPAGTVYALLLGFATGRRGRSLFNTPWCRVLDADAAELVEQALLAKSLGLLDFKQSGSIIDVSFPPTLIPPRSFSHGSYRSAG